MIYKFKSKAAGDVIMMGPNGDAVLRAAGREPAPKGIFEADAMPALIAALEAAIAAEETPADGDDDSSGAPRSVALRQRAWPLVEMLRRAHAAGQPVVWGV